MWSNWLFKIKKCNKGRFYLKCDELIKFAFFVMVVCLWFANKFKSCNWHIHWIQHQIGSCPEHPTEIKFMLKNSLGQRLTSIPYLLRSSLKTYVFNAHNYVRTLMLNDTQNAMLMLNQWMQQESARMSNILH